MTKNHFFCTEKNWHMGLGWYESLYPPRREGAIRGEASPNYSKWPAFSGVPERIRAVCPGVKLVYLVRDPVARTVSHYLHNVAEGTESRPFEEIVRSVPDGHYVICSRYFTQLQQYSGYFAADQILVVKAEDLRDRRRSALRKTFGFLGVDESFWDASFDHVYHETREKRRINALGKAGRRLGISWRVTRIGGIAERIYKRLTTGVLATDVMSEETELALRELFREEMLDLSREYSVEISDWGLGNRRAGNPPQSVQ